MLKQLISSLYYRAKYTLSPEAVNSIKQKNPNYRDKWSNTPLHIAVILAKKKAIDKFSSIGFDKENDLGFSPYLLAKYLHPESLFTKLFPEKKQKHPLLLQTNGKQEKLSRKKQRDIFNYTPIDSLKFSSYSLLCQSSYYHLKSSSLIEDYTDEFFPLLYQDKLSSPCDYPYYVKWVNDKVGYGLFAKQNIPKSYLLGEYAGIARYTSFIPSSNPFLFSYSFPEFRKTCVDAKSFANPLRFVNHSYQSNVKCVKLFFENILHIFVLSQDEIKKDEQLLMDYGPYFWRYYSPSYLNS
ncbi:MAG: SET domain-containing protein-lysine N-methyltransferase [Chlamydiales bacterium]|nr:SET domain-containing protein-lysine N-methyltransferase [Chlamydiales bacterium]NCF70550.1 SET domain-containing protein-lysine N-methyltransferase [Chlamydiales bacterium]